MTRELHDRLKEVYQNGTTHAAHEKKGEKQMKRGNFYDLMENVVKGLTMQVRETVEGAYDLGFKNGCGTIKRYAVNVCRFDCGMILKDVFKMFVTLEDAKKYMSRVESDCECRAFLYEYNHINEQYESVEA